MKSLKPGQICQIRGVQPQRPGYGCNGSVVTLVEIKRELPESGNIWTINPAIAIEGHTYTGCADKYLWPLEDFEWDQELLDLALEQTFQEQLCRALKI